MNHPRQVPRERIFGKTQDDLDPELWDGDRLKPKVRKALLERLNSVLKDFDQSWHQWTKVYFAGSQASYWWNNRDLDILLGIDYDRIREQAEGLEGLTNEEIQKKVNSALRSDFNDPEYKAPWSDEPYELTGYNNLNSLDIRNIRPYAGYELLEGRWYVKPPHLPHWDASQFPQGVGLWGYINGIANSIKGILEMPDPYRTRQGAALWEFLHSNRSDAFDEEGQGWYDVPNVTEKYLDQLGLWKELLALKKAHDAGDYDRGESWNNDPTQLGKTAHMVAIKPPAEAMEHLLPKRKPESLEDLHMTLVCLEDDHEQGHLEELPDVVAEWAQHIDPVTLTVNGLGTFMNGDEHVLWAGVDHPDLNRIQESLAMWLVEHGYRIKENYSYKPHITLGYSPHHVRFLPKLHEQISFDSDEVEVHLSGYGETKNIKTVRIGGNHGGE